MEQIDIVTKLEILEHKVDQIAQTVDHIRKYLFWTFVVTVVVVVLPLVGLLFVVPMFLHNYTGTLESISGL